VCARSEIAAEAAARTLRRGSLKLPQQNTTTPSMDAKAASGGRLVEPGPASGGPGRYPRKIRSHSEAGPCQIRAEHHRHTAAIRTSVRIADAGPSLPGRRTRRRWSPGRPPSRPKWSRAREGMRGDRMMRSSRGARIEGRGRRKRLGLGPCLLIAREGKNGSLRCVFFSRPRR